MRWITFFTSFSTLLCCALPSLMVAIGAGSTLVSLFTHWPWMITISEYKEVTWFVAGSLLSFNGWRLWKNRNAPCPLDPDLARTCAQARHFSLWLWGGSMIIYIVGVGWALAGEWIS